MADGAGTHVERVADAPPLGREHAGRMELARAVVVAGLLAGGAMLACIGAGAAIDGVAPTHPLLAAAAMFGEGVGGPPGVIAGALLWAAVSIALAALYAAVVPHDFPFVSAAGVGVGYSFFVLGVTTSLVLPWVNPVMRASMAARGGAWVLAYFVFGVALGFLPALRRRAG